MEDELIATIPIRLSTHLKPNLHLHQFPLLGRPLEVPPSAAASGKRIKARCKPSSERYEIHVPVDMRQDVWNPEQGKEFGTALAEQDQEELAASGQGEVKPKTRKKKGKKEEDEDDVKGEKSEKRLGEVRMRSEKVENQGEYFVGVVRDGELHLHPVSNVHQFRPTLTYLDALARRKNPTVGDDDDEEDEEAEKKVKPSGKEILVSARGSTDATTNAMLGGLSVVRREMITSIRQEQEEPWQDMEWNGEKSTYAEESFESLFSSKDTPLQCTSRLGDTLTKIQGLN